MTRLDDCQYLLVSQINDTLTNFADHGEPCRHDAINRSLRGERITPRLVWENVRGPAVLTPHGSVLCDDTVRDKHASGAIALVRAPSSGNATAVITGLGGGPCVSVNPATDQCWLIDYRLDESDGDGTHKRDHVRARLTTGGLAAAPALAGCADGQVGRHQRPDGVHGVRAPRLLLPAPGQPAGG